ncbi:hypothetical protein J8F10_12215 [Gemmata sp. G18]|uniref:Uncharacterized protein n=1 Tax=Gemmata palustris TaxID=2822762 RepID=A0ABS5BQN4_9BACT|nr:hypothetical protein [Gemmata palustris]MBP3956047.1 hypothetical protein [Gemmata palustris]
MIQVTWQDEGLDVTRLVYGDDCPFRATLDRIAARFALDVADDRTSPRPGDFWIGCHPRAGWGTADANLIGWAGLVDVPQAVSALRRATAELVPAGSRVAAAPAFGFAVAFR